MARLPAPVFHTKRILLSTISSARKSNTSSPASFTVFLLLGI